MTLAVVAMRSLRRPAMLVFALHVVCHNDHYPILSELQDAIFQRGWEAHGQSLGVIGIAAWKEKSLVVAAELMNGETTKVINAHVTSYTASKQELSLVWFW
jgi:hypothetical protein